MKMRLLPNGEVVKMRHCYGKSFNDVKDQCSSHIICEYGVVCVGDVLLPMSSVV